MKLIPTKNPEQCHKIICEIKNSWFLLMIVITNSITMVAPLNAGSCQAVSKHVVALCPRFLFSLRSKRKLRHCGNNMFGNSLTRASISLSNHCALISYDNHRKSAFFDVTTYYFKLGIQWLRLSKKSANVKKIHVKITVSIVLTYMDYLVPC